MTSLIIYPLLTAALYYLMARAEITAPLWRRYPSWLDKFMNCAACAGFWYGAGAAVLGGWVLALPFLALPARSPYTVAIVGLCSMVWTPVVSWVHLRAIEQLGGAEEEPEACPDCGRAPSGHWGATIHCKRCGQG